MKLTSELGKKQVSLYAI